MTTGRPLLGAELVDRERLIEAMNRADEVPVTLVSAPAGYGRSVPVAQWVRHGIERQAAVVTAAGG